MKYALLISYLCRYLQTYFLTLPLLWGYISLVVMWPSKLWRYILETRRCKLRILIYELMDNLWIKFSRNSIWQHFIQRTNYNECYYSKLNVLEGITIRKIDWSKEYQVWFIGLCNDMMWYFWSNKDRLTSNKVHGFVDLDRLREFAWRNEWKHEHFWDTQ